MDRRTWGTFSPFKQLTQITQIIPVTAERKVPVQGVNQQQ